MINRLGFIPRTGTHIRLLLWLALTYTVQRAISTLPGTLRQRKPWIRRIRTISAQVAAADTPGSR